MQEISNKCRCCGYEFQDGRVCPRCGYDVIISFEKDDQRLEARAKKYREEHAHAIVSKSGIVFQEPAVWSGEKLQSGKNAYLELANVLELTEEFQWNLSTEFASFGRGEDAVLRIYFEYLDGSKEEREVTIALPPVRGVTWKTAVRLSEKRDGVEFAVGTPERFSKTETVKFCTVKR